MRRVLGKRGDEGHYGMVVSGATIIEFFDQLAHLVDALQYRILQIPKKYAITNEKTLRESLITSDELRRDLSVLTKAGLDRRMRAPINRLLQLLDSGVLRGIGDVLSPESIRAATDRNQFDRFVGEHRAKRLPGDQRALDDSLFHYKIDAANNCLTLAAAKLEGLRALFVTQTPLNVQQCTVGRHAYARLERTPLFLLNTNRLHHRGIIGDELEFFKAAAREAVQLIQELRNYQELEACPAHHQLSLGRFYQDYVSFLNKAPLEGELNAEVDNVDEIMNAIADPKRIQQLLDEAIHDIKDGATLIELHQTSFDLPYIEQFDFTDDPVLARIRKDLGVSFKQ